MLELIRDLVKFFQYIYMHIYVQMKVVCRAINQASPGIKT